MFLYCRYSDFQHPWEHPLELELKLAWGSLA
jgi:hypothetical protein